MEVLSLLLPSWTMMVSEIECAVSHMTALFCLVVLTVGMQQSSITSSESAGNVMVCAVLNGPAGGLEGRNAEIQLTTNGQQSGAFLLYLISLVTYCYSQVSIFIYSHKIVSVWSTD